MAGDLEADICVIGAGSAGLSVAAGASMLGAKTVLIEKGEMGGDCLNTGCVPSKALLAAGHAARFGAGTAPFGIRYAAPEIDFAAVRRHVKEVIAAIAPMDSVERFEGLGVTVIKAAARFIGPREVAAGDTRVRARRIVLAAGSRPLVPPVPGLDRVPYLTTETVFELTERPRHLIVVGGGPIGCELGQAFRRLGAEVSIVEIGGLLPKDDPELTGRVRAALRRDGVTLHERTKLAGVSPAGDGIAVTLEPAGGGAARDLEGSRLLLAAGRVPRLEGLGLEAAGIASDRGGVTVDARLRTSNRHVYAAGDIAGGPRFTHVAGYHAGIIIRNALFRIPAKVNYGAIPWVTYCDPELAHVGLTERDARSRHGDVKVLRSPFAENDRARAERRAEGLIKVVTTPKGKVLGVSIVGANAGELIQPWVLCLAEGLKIGAMARAVAPYPTLGEVGKRAAGSFFTPKLFSARTRWLVRMLARLG